MARIGDLFNNPQLKFLNWFTDQPIGGRMATWPGPPFRMSETPRRSPGQVAAPGADAAILQDLASTRTKEAAEMNDMITKHLPLSGSACWISPGAAPAWFATKAMADHGAEVLKVETATHFDFPRTMGPYAGGIKGHNRSAYFTNRNSSKLGITLNMKTKDAVKLARQLVPTCDVVINNLRAGVLERLGLGYQDCAGLRPDIIYVSMPLQGNAGPQAGYAGVGHTLNVMAGIYGVTGYRGGPMIGPGTNYPDHSVNPGHGLVAILAALLHRKRTGRGQYVEVSQLESTLCFAGPATARL